MIFPMKKTAKSKLAASKPRVSKPACIVHVHPAFAEFYVDGDKTPTSRISNGAAGSDAAAALAQVITTHRKAFAVKVRTFDAAGKEDGS